MEKKRILPPRAAARHEPANKRRNVSTRGFTPAVVQLPPREPTPPPAPPTPPPPLPKSIEVGKPLPTIEEAQAADLSDKEYQSLTESGVLSESILRSRHKWINEGLFEKFWTKPHKRKGVLQEDPNNPPKDSMMKVGMVTITIEPHIVEATMFAVKTSKLLPHQQDRFNPRPQPQSPAHVQPTQSIPSPASTHMQPRQQQQQQHEQVKTISEAGQPPQLPGHPTSQQTSSALARPVLQYGPHNGSMPPRPTPAAPVDTTTRPNPTPRAPLPAGTALSTTSPKPTILANPASENPANAPPATSQSPMGTASVAVTATPAPVSKLGPAPASSIASANMAPPPAAPSPPPPLLPGATVQSQSFFAPVPNLQNQQSPTLAHQIQAQRLPTAGFNQNRPPQSSNTMSQSAVPAAGAASAQAPLPATRAPPTQVAAPPRPAPRPTPRPTPRPAACALNQSASPAQGKPVAPAGAPTTGAPAARVATAAPAKPAANDPVIALLAQKASKDPELRDLMKRVAVGEAKSGELAQFQKIIDDLNAEYKQTGGQQGPSADRLLVDGRTVKYFADEVRTILDIVLASNPNQKSSELRPPPRSDPLVVLLVKTALEDQRTKDMIRRIADGKPGFTDATDLKQILDRLHRDAKIAPQAPLPGPPPLRASATSGPAVGGGGGGGGGGGSHQKTSTPKSTQQQSNSHSQALLRSKGPPPPASRPDVSAVVFDFGSGDRYLFPKYSILEFLPTKSGQQVVASFLIVRKGSTSEYGGDPNLDYYQPVTIRLQTSSGRHLENLARVVAPQDEVRRYMDDVMDNMTRAEYVLLAMRLPRADFDPEEGVGAVEESKASSPSPKSEPETDQNSTPKPDVLWTTRRNGNGNGNNSNGGGRGDKRAMNPSLKVKLRDPEQEAQTKYERLIRSVAEKEVDAL
ncbi:hypothetical protein E4U54_008814 [Claviceps lovelessii]|nr:hypothetical protein E4U54_008814 [Claviceps lovelessii]